MSVDEPQHNPESPAHITATPPANQTGTAITSVPDDPAPIPLPPLKLPITSGPDEDERRARYDIVLVVLALLFGFSQGAHEAKNSDLWMHLAAGRDMLAGKYNPFSGHDPYSYSTTEARWVNHSWLYDVVLYGVHSIGGIAALIAFHALLAAAMALVLVLVGRIGPGLWLPALASAVAILASSTRFFLQPTMVSFLFLGLTLWFLQRGGRWNYRPKQVSETTSVTWKDYWPIVPLFIAWVNLDEWFFLGPLTIGLYTLGQFFQRNDEETQPRQGEIKALTTILVAGAFACIVNPQHVFAFTLPVQLGLSPVASVLKEDSAIRPLFGSPFNANYFTPENLHAAHLAFFVLAVLTLLSFAVNYRAVRWWRVSVTSVFFVLACWHGRSVPFFAIVAGPVFALNMQEAARRRQSLVRGHDPLPDLGRAFTFLALLALLVTAYPGWLHLRPHERHRVSFADGLDPSLKESALFLKRLHEDGTLKPDARGFHFSPEVGNALAWYAPEVKGFFDSRYAIHSQSAPDFIQARRSLYADPDPRTRPPKGEDWRTIFKRRGIDYVVLYAPQTDRLLTPMLWLATDPRASLTKDWVLLDLNGTTAVFGRSGREEYRKHAVDFKRLAYDPTKENLAPADGMRRLPQAPPFWAAFSDPPPSRTPEADETQIQMLQFGIGAYQTRRLNQEVWENSLAAATIGGGIPSGAIAPLTLLTPLTLSKAFREAIVISLSDTQEDLPRISGIVYYQFFGTFLQTLDDGPPENLLLAIRAGRRGLHDQPNSKGLAELGVAYHQLLTRTRERNWAGQLRWVDPVKGQLRLQRYPLAQLRHVQIVSALQGSLLYRNDRDVVHDRLAEMYGNLGSADNEGELVYGFKDVELAHRKAQLRYLRQAGPRSGDPPGQYEERIKNLTAEVERLTKLVEGWTNRFDIQQKRIDKLFDRAHKALELNLAGKALEVLLAGTAKEITPECVQMQVELGLMLGRLNEVQSWMETLPDARATLSDPRVFPVEYSYLWMQTLLAAAKGDYAAADAALVELIDKSGKGEVYTALVHMNEVGIKTTPPVPRITPEEGVALVATKAIGDALVPPSTFWTGLSAPVRNAVLSSRCRALLDRTVEMAHLHLFRAMLALEQGDRQRATDALDRAIELAEAYRGPDKRVPPFPTLIIAEQLRERVKVK